MSIIKNKLEQDIQLQKITTMPIYYVITLLSSALKTHISSFKVSIFEQVYGKPMESIISPTVANLFMEEFET